MENGCCRLHHEDLDAYQAAIEFFALAIGLIGRFPKGYATLCEQLKRAALSVPLNIAEGAGKRKPADCARFYDIARGSAHECAAIFDAAKIIGIIDSDRWACGKKLLHRIVSMLVKMVR